MAFVKIRDLPPDTLLIPGGFAEMKHTFWLNKDEQSSITRWGENLSNLRAQLWNNPNPCAEIDIPMGKTFNIKATFSISSEDIASLNNVTLPIIEDTDDEEDYQLPSYSEPGSITVWVGPREPFKSGFKHEYVILELDTGTCAFWINEGVGVDYWLDEHCQFPDEGGIFVVENITGAVYAGNGWDTDSDEEWEFERLRPATLFEIDLERGELQEFLTETEISNLV